MKLTQETLRRALDYCDGQLVWCAPAPKGRIVGQVAGTRLGNDYIQIRLGYRKYLAHRLIWFWHHGTWPDYLDHIDCNRSNNRIENLRPATRSQNAGNQKSTKGERQTTSRWRGVHWATKSGKWRATLQTKARSSVHLGLFECEEDAAMAYNEAALAHFGEFATLNEAEQPEIR